MRIDKREPDQLREITITRSYTSLPAGSVLIESGLTRILCTASVQDQVPLWLRGSGSGWVTAEYAMLPGSTGTRKAREGRNGRIDGRSQEIQRLIGRCLRSVTDLTLFPDRTIYLDCDVLQADGGTRTLAINGAWVALHDALKTLKDQGVLEKWPLKTQVAAISVGIVEGTPLLDLCYKEDSRAEVDMNIVMTGQGDYVEVQGSAEKGTFNHPQLQDLLSLAGKGIEEILAHQRQATGGER